jgi:hypothetical protein
MSYKTEVLSLDPRVADPPPVDGEIWYHQLAGTHRARQNGVTVDIPGAAPGAPAILLWGDNRIAASVTTRYLTPGYDDGTAETSPTQFRVPAAGTLRLLRVRQNVVGAGAPLVAYTVLVNGAPTALAVSMPPTVTDGADLANTVPVAAGDLLAIRITKAAPLGSSPRNIVASLEVA